jgi:fructose/tagatose bisphosphate aldolase
MLCFHFANIRQQWLEMEIGITGGEEDGKLRPSLKGALRLTNHRRQQRGC